MRIDGGVAARAKNFHDTLDVLITAFVGANLLQFGFTNFCPLGLILKKLGVPESKFSCGS